MYTYAKRFRERERERKRKSIFVFVKIYRFVQRHPHEYTHIGMGWLRFVGALKVKVSNEKEPYKRDDILQKRPIILRSLLIVATPHVGSTGT